MLGAIVLLMEGEYPFRLRWEALLPVRLVLSAAIVAGFWACAIAAQEIPRGQGIQSGEKITLRENIEVGQKIAFETLSHYHATSVRIADGQTRTIEHDTVQFFKALQVVLARKDGLPTAIRVTVDPASYNIEKEDAQAAVKSPCSVAGKTFTVRRRADDSVATDYNGDIIQADRENVLGLLSPDEDLFPDRPIAVGDAWDASGKLASHNHLGKDDQLQAPCKLDWIKVIDGRKMAQITCSMSVLRKEDQDLEIQMNIVSTALVDVATSQIVQFDQKRALKVSSCSGQPVQVTENAEFTIHGQLDPTPGTGSATRP